MKLKIKKLVDDAIAPSRAHPGDAGLDVYACEDRIIPPKESALISTGISVQLPPGTEGQIRPRSGLAAKHMITVLNTPGTIDEGYRGEVKVCLINHGNQGFLVEKGARIAQMVIQPVLNVEIEEAEDLDGSDRGQGGFGSSGK